MRIVSIKEILVFVLFCLFYDDANICSNDAIESGFGPVTADIAKTSFNCSCRFSSDLSRSEDGQSSTSYRESPIDLRDLGLELPAWDRVRSRLCISV